MAQQNTWRALCRPLIAEVLLENKGKTQKEINKALKEAYPWGQRSMHPYKIWCDEIKVQKGIKRFGKKNPIANKSQTSLF